MINIDKIKFEIVENLKPINPERIVLFGSYVYGKPDDNSDIDLYIVTRDDFMPRNFKEKNILFLKVSKLLWDIKRRVPTDIIVHTRPMHEKFVNLRSSFSKTILTKGIDLI